MHAGQQTDMKRGAIWASVIPVCLAILIAIEPLVDTWQRASARALRRGQDGFVDTDIASMGFVVLLAVLLILSGPLTAWLMCRRLAKIEEAEQLSRWSTSAKQSVLNASFVHASFAITYGIIFSLFVISSWGASGSKWDAVEEVLPMFGIYLLINVGIWVVVTLPLSLFCARIFWRVTKFPSDRTVFNPHA